MAVKLRLVRMGKKKQPTYRLVAADSRSPRDGRFLEILGTYAPRGRSTADPDAVVSIDNEKALKWLRDGAQPTDRVEKLLRISGALDNSTTPPHASTAHSPANTRERGANAGDDNADVVDSSDSSDSGEAGDSNEVVDSK